MSILRCWLLVVFGLAFCAGCGDSSSQPWENAKPQTGGGKSSDKPAKASDNAAGDTASGDAESPHGMANPHAGMQMPANTPDVVMENDGKLDAGSVHWTVPKDWIRKQPKSSMLLAEYGIPKAKGDKADGRLTVSQAGGDMEGNIIRWEGQFGEKPDDEKKETLDVGGIKITLVDLSGTFTDKMSGTGPSDNYRMLGAIFKLPDDDALTFIKCYGPRKTISANADEIKAFVRSIKLDK